jgi:hypothetical protein
LRIGASSPTSKCPSIFAHRNRIVDNGVAIDVTGETKGVIVNNELKETRTLASRIGIRKVGQSSDIRLADNRIKAQYVARL